MNNKQKPKVLVAYQYFATYRESILSYLLESQKFDFYFASGVETNIPIKILDESYFNNVVNGFKNKWTKLQNYWFGNFLIQKGLIKEIKKRNVTSVIFLADPHYLSTWFAIVYCRMKNIKVIIWTHGTFTDNKIKNFLKMTLFNLADQILLYGDNAKAGLLKRGVSRHRLQVIYNSLNYENQVKFRNKLVNKVFDGFDFFEDKSLPTIVFIGRLTKQKKLDELISVVKSLKSQDIECNLLFLGDGDEREALVNYSKVNQLDKNIHFFGACYNEEVLAYYIYHSDLCVSPGNVGLTAMHVLAYGTPVISHNDFTNQMPEVESIIEGLNGGLFIKDDYLSLVKTVQYWLSQKHIRNKTRNECIKIIEQKYNPATQLELIEVSLGKIYGLNEVN